MEYISESQWIFGFNEEGHDLIRMETKKEMVDFLNKEAGTKSLNLKRIKEAAHALNIKEANSFLLLEVIDGKVINHSFLC